MTSRVSCNDKSETKLHFILEKTIITVREMNTFIIERDLISGNKVTTILSDLIRGKNMNTDKLRQIYRQYYDGK